MNVVELTKSLISCPSVTPNNEGVLDLLQKELTDMGFTCNRYLFSDTDTPDVDNLFAKIGSGAPHLCFGGHTDVVPVGDENAWSSNPFEATEKNGKLYGRGASDMKSAIAAFVSAVREYLENNQVKGTISLLITNDEEGPAINGTRKVLEEIYKNGEKIDSCLVGEPTCPSNLGEMIKIGRRGSLTGKLIIFGLQGHVAYPSRANNPSTIIVNILKKLKEIQFDKGTRDFQPTNLEVTRININNTADNVIPATAEATFNIRFNNKHSSNSLKKKLNKIFRKITKKHKSKFKIEYRVSGEAFLTKPNKTTFMIQNIIKKITKLKPKLSTTGGTSDLRFIRTICPGLEFGLVGKTMHKVDEAVSLKDLKNLTKIYQNILQNYFK